MKTRRITVIAACLTLCAVVARAHEIGRPRSRRRSIQPVRRIRSMLSLTRMPY